MSKVESRKLQIRASQENEFALVGRAVKYNDISSNELSPGLRERIMPGCFAASLASGTDVKALLNHDQTGLPLGRLANSTLRLMDSTAGLDIKIELDRNNGVHRDVYAAVKRQDISEMSFSFSCEDEDVSSETYQGQRCQVRNVRKASLYDVSIVTSPFYGDNATFVAARNNNNVDETFRRLTARATDSIQHADEQRRERAHTVIQRIAGEKQKDEAFEAACERACRELDPPLDFCDVDEDQNFIYGSNPDDLDEQNCLRFSYQVDGEGNVVLDESTRTRMKHELLHSERGRRILWLKGIARRARGGR